MTLQKEGGASWQVVIGVSIIHLSILPVVQCFGLLYDRGFQALGMSTVAISFLIHINNGTASILGLLCAPILRQHSFRSVTLIGCLLCCLSICLMSQANSWLSFMMTYSLLFGMGQGILYPSTSLAINSHFKIRRSLAVGLSVAATSFGPVLSPYAVNTLLSNYGTSGTVLVLGGIALHSLAGGMLLRPRPPALSRQHENTVKEKLLEMENRSDIEVTRSTQDIPETKDLLVISTSPLRTRIKETEQQPFMGGLKGNGHFPVAKKFCARMVKALDLDLLKDPIYVNIAMGMGISIASEFNFQMLLPFILVDMAKLDKHTLATVMSVQAGADITARIVSPLLANWLHWDARCVYVASLLGSMLGRTVLAHFHLDYKIILIQAIIVGIFKGLKAVFQALVLPNYVPLEKLPAASGLYMILNGSLSMICGPLIGFVRDKSDSYVTALYATSGLSLLCVFSWAAEYLYKYYIREHTLEECTT